VSLKSDNVLVAGAQIGLARSLTQQGKATEALPLLTSAIRIADASLGMDNPVSATARTAMGLALLALGRHREAQQLLTASLPSIEATYGARAVITRETMAAIKQLTAAQLPKNN
jgi:thioredoxin-like negative regulator of GroEL